MERDKVLNRLKRSLQFSSMIYYDLFKKNVCFLKTLLTSNVIQLMNCKSDIFHQHAGCQLHFLLGMLFHLKAIQWHTDICVVLRIKSPSGLAGIQND